MPKRRLPATPIPVPTILDGKRVIVCASCQKHRQWSKLATIFNSGWIVSSIGWKCEICRYDHFGKAMIDIIRSTHLEEESIKAKREDFGGSTMPRMLKRK